MTISDATEPMLEYDDDMIVLLEAVWGEGFMSPGGTSEVDRILNGLNLAGARALDIGCGLGGATLHIARNYDIKGIIGVDIEENLISACENLALSNGLFEKMQFQLVEPGSLPVADDSLEIVFSKESIIHIADKHSLTKDIFRCLKSGGWFAASDWLAGYAGAPSTEMQDYISAEGLDFGLAQDAVYQSALEAAGFVDIQITDRNAWYRQEARRELENLTGVLQEHLESTVGEQFYQREIDVWRKMIVVLDRGELQPTHLRARKP
jgi:SAM-dependent methyltransferase